MRDPNQEATVSDQAWDGRGRRLPAGVSVGFWLVLGAAAWGQAQEPQAVRRPGAARHVLLGGESVRAFREKVEEQFYPWIAGKGRNDPDGVFEVIELDGEPVLHIDGNGYGGLTTRDRWADYRLVLEFKWGEKTLLDRAGKARDSGLLLHCQGPDGNVSAKLDGPWKQSIEFQMIEGGTGDLLLVGGHDAAGERRVVTIEVPSRKDRDGEPTYDPRAPWVKYESTVRVNWFGRDEDWEDRAGFRGKRDVENPRGEWNRCVVIAEGDRLEYFVNGIKVNEGRNASLSEGQILLQTEGAELYVRRLELLPLGTKSID
jgi:hypothetical protein